MNTACSGRRQRFPVRAPHYFGRYGDTQGILAEMDGTTRLVDGTAGTGYEYGRLEVFLRGFWSNVCNNDRFTPDAAQVACKAFGYDGGAALRFTQSYAESLSQVLILYID
eukprot:jgi/Ulvmu1/3680/UM017_0096.1